jgi:predicted enzyme related to lactoylglutathione lyase
MGLLPGLFGWVDLATSDVDRARDFYSGLFGWEMEEIPTPMGVSYTMCRLGGKQVAGMGPQPPGMAAAGVPSTWNSYVMVESADRTCSAAEAAGAAVVMPAMDVMTQGRMAMIADPSGAVFGIWEPRDHEGAEVFNVPGALTWNELQTRDLAAAMPFYSEVFGWRWEEMPDSGGYQVAHLDAKEGPDTSNGGAMSMPEGVPPEAPSYWAVYFAVESCEDATALAERLDGSVFLPPMAMGPGVFSGVTDPTGAMFFLGHFAAE